MAISFVSDSADEYGGIPQEYGNEDDFSATEAFTDDEEYIVEQSDDIDIDQTTSAEDETPVIDEPEPDAPDIDDYGQDGDGDDNDDEPEEAQSAAPDRGDDEPITVIAPPHQMTPEEELSHAFADAVYQASLHPDQQYDLGDLMYQAAQSDTLSDEARQLYDDITNEQAFRLGYGSSPLPPNVTYDTAYNNAIALGRKTPYTSEQGYDVLTLNINSIKTAAQAMSVLPPNAFVFDVRGYPLSTVAAWANREKKIDALADNLRKAGLNFSSDTNILEGMRALGASRDQNLAVSGSEPKKDKSGNTYYTVDYDRLAKRQDFASDVSYLADNIEWFRSNGYIPVILDSGTDPQSGRTATLIGMALERKGLSVGCMEVKTRDPHEGESPWDGVTKASITSCGDICAQQAFDTTSIIGDFRDLHFSSDGYIGVHPGKEVTPGTTATEQSQYSLAGPNYGTQAEVRFMSKADVNREGSPVLLNVKGSDITVAFRIRTQKTDSAVYDKEFSNIRDTAYANRANLVYRTLSEPRDGETSLHDLLHSPDTAAKNAADIVEKCVSRVLENLYDEQEEDEVPTIVINFGGTNEAALLTEKRDRPVNEDGEAWAPQALSDLGGGRTYEFNPPDISQDDLNQWAINVLGEVQRQSLDEAGNPRFRFKVLTDGETGVAEAFTIASQYWGVETIVRGDGYTLASPRKGALGQKVEHEASFWNRFQLGYDDKPTAERLTAQTLVRERKNDMAVSGGTALSRKNLQALARMGYGLRDIARLCEYSEAYCKEKKIGDINTPDVLSNYITYSYVNRILRTGEDSTLPSPEEVKKTLMQVDAINAAAAKKGIGTITYLDPQMSEGMRRGADLPEFVINGKSIAFSETMKRAADGGFDRTVTVPLSDGEKAPARSFEEQFLHRHADGSVTMDVDWDKYWAQWNKYTDDEQKRINLRRLPADLPAEMSYYGNADILGKTVFVNTFGLELSDTNEAFQQIRSYAGTDTAVSLALSDDPMIRKAIDVALSSGVKVALYVPDEIYSDSAVALKKQVIAGGGVIVGPSIHANPAPADEISEAISRMPDLTKAVTEADTQSLSQSTELARRVPGEMEQRAENMAAANSTTNILEQTVNGGNTDKTAEEKEKKRKEMAAKAYQTLETFIDNYKRMGTVEALLYMLIGTGVAGVKLTKVLAKSLSKLARKDVSQSAEERERLNKTAKDAVKALSAKIRLIATGKKGYADCKPGEEFKIQLENKELFRNKTIPAYITQGVTHLFVDLNDKEAVKALTNHFDGKEAIQLHDQTEMRAFKESVEALNPGGTGPRHVSAEHERFFLNDGKVYTIHDEEAGLCGRNILPRNIREDNWRMFNKLKAVAAYASDLQYKELGVNPGQKGFSFSRADYLEIDRNEIRLMRGGVITATISYTDKGSIKIDKNNPSSGENTPALPTLTLSGKDLIVKSDKERMVLLQNFKEELEALLLDEPLSVREYRASREYQEAAEAQGNPYTPVLREKNHILAHDDLLEQDRMQTSYKVTHLKWVSVSEAKTMVDNAITESRENLSREKTEREAIEKRLQKETLSEQERSRLNAQWTEKDRHVTIYETQTANLEATAKELAKKKSTDMMQYDEASGTLMMPKGAIRLNDHLTTVPEMTRANLSNAHGTAPGHTTEETTETRTTTQTTSKTVEEMSSVRSPQQKEKPELNLELLSQDSDGKKRYRQGDEVIISYSGQEVAAKVNDVLPVGDISVASLYGAGEPPKMALLDNQGRILVPEVFTGSSIAEDGKTIMLKAEGDNGEKLFNIFDVEKQQLLSKEWFSSVTEMKEDRAQVIRQDGTEGTLSRSGELKIETTTKQTTTKTQKHHKSKAIKPPKIIGLKLS